MAGYEGWRHARREGVRWMRRKDKGGNGGSDDEGEEEGGEIRRWTGKWRQGREKATRGEKVQKENKERKKKRKTRKSLPTNIERRKVLNPRA